VAPQPWSLKLANAPVSWGVDYPDDPKNPGWQSVMSQIAEAGFRYTELGPYGYYPTDVKRLPEEFRARGLSVVAGFIFQPLHLPSAEKQVLAIAEKTCSLLSVVGARQLVVIDHISPERMQTAGDQDSAVPLDDDRFKYMIDLIRQLAQVALEHGVMPVIHQHAGCYIEFEAELERVLAELDSDQVGVCLDTGHMAYAGIDAIAFFQRHHERVKYFHFKDIDPKVHRQVLKDKVSFLDAVSQNIFCPLGRGVTDWEALRNAILEHHFNGYATIEQDIDPTVSFDALKHAQDSLNYLRFIGF
jgi:inosose dehydratase